MFHRPSAAKQPNSDGEQVASAEQSSSSTEYDEDEEEQKDAVAALDGHLPNEDDDEEMQAMRALAPQNVMKKIRRVDTTKQLSKGIPGNYEDFSYTEAKKVVADIKKQENFIMQKLKIGLAKMMMNKDTAALEK